MSLVGCEAGEGMCSFSSDNVDAGADIFQFNRWITYDPDSRQFSVTPFALELETALKSETISELEKMDETKSGSTLYLVRHRFQLPGLQDGVPCPPSTG